MNATTDDEQQLIRLAQAGDLAAFHRLAEQHAVALCRCAFTLCRDHQSAEDIAQEALVEAWKSLSRFDGRCRFSTWLYGILRHRFWKACRRRSNAAATPLQDVRAELQPQSSSTPVTSLQQSEDAKRVRQAVADLNEEHRLVIELRFFAEASLEEIAAALDCPLGTVKSRLHNGLEKLRKLNLSVNLFGLSEESRVRKP